MSLMDSFKEDMLKEVNAKMEPALKQLNDLCNTINKFAGGMDSFQQTAKEMNDHLKNIEAYLKAIAAAVEKKNG